MMCWCISSSWNPDQAALAAGISEALNTATGIGTSAVAIISYNFTSKIDDLTYSIDEAVSIVNLQKIQRKFEAIIILIFISNKTKRMAKIKIKKNWVY
jgi:hypothetical protein